MEEKLFTLLEKSLFFAGLMAVLVLISLPVNADTLLISENNGVSLSGSPTAFLSDYSSSGFTVPASPSLGITSLLSGYHDFSSFGTGTILPGTGSSSGTLNLISSALNNYKTTPTAFTDYSYISSYMPTCYGA